MSDPIITKIRFRVSPYMPVSGTVDGERFQDVFRILFKIKVPKDLDCPKYKIHVEVWEHDTTSPDDLIAGNPFGVDRCYELSPGEYTFYIGNVDPFGNPLPSNIDDAASQTNNKLSPGNFRLPPWSPIVLSGDPGDHYEFYAKVALIPCCEEADEVSLDSLNQESRLLGGPDILQQIAEWIERIGGTVVSAAKSAAKGG